MKWEQNQQGERIGDLFSLAQKVPGTSPSSLERDVPREFIGQLWEVKLKLPSSEENSDRDILNLLAQVF